MGEKTIWKYTLAPTKRQVIEVWATGPVRPLNVQIQAGVGVALWAEVTGGVSYRLMYPNDAAPAQKLDPNLSLVRLTITLVGTGDAVPNDAGDYLSTVQDGPMVWHFYWR